MKKEIQFANTLEKIKKLAREQGNCIQEEQIKEAFFELQLSEEQLQLVYDYLNKNNIGINEPIAIEEFLSEEEKDYLQTYLSEVDFLQADSEQERAAVTLTAMSGDKVAKKRLMEMYLKEVVDIAKLYIGQGVLVEDLIGEGNFSLVTEIENLQNLEQYEQAQGTIVRGIMNAIEVYIEENTDKTKLDWKIVKRTNEILEKAKELSEDLKRKVTPEELAQETGLKLDTVLEAVRLSGDNIEYLESVN